MTQFELVIDSLTISAERQGGDLRGLPTAVANAVIDLGTCVNRLGPPAGVGSVLAAFDPRMLRAHPYEAEGQFRHAYAEYLGVDPAHLVVGRGISEFIGVLAAVLPPDETAVIAPDYTEIIKAFTTHLMPHVLTVSDTPEDRLERLRDGMRHFRYVVLSNPCNPTGVRISTVDLARACVDYPQAVLVVDESYIDFLADPADAMLGIDLPNVIVLRSPSKVFGIGGARCGALWTRHAQLRRGVARRMMTWPLSLLDSMVAVAALDGSDSSAGASWVSKSTLRLRFCADRMESQLRHAGIGEVTPSPTHFRFLVTPQPKRVSDTFLAYGFVTRPFDPAEPGRVAGVRIATPLEEELADFEAAVASLRAHVTG